MYFSVGEVGLYLNNGAIHKAGNSAIHKAAGLTVPGHSMTLPGTIPENLLSHEWGQRLEWSEVLPTADRINVIKVINYYS